MRHLYRGLALTSCVTSPNKGISHKKKNDDKEYSVLLDTVLKNMFLFFSVFFDADSKPEVHFLQSLL